MEGRVRMMAAVALAASLALPCRGEEAAGAVLDGWELSLKASTLGAGVEVRWLVPNGLDADPQHPFGVTDSDRVQPYSTQTVPAFTSVRVAVTSVPAVFSVVAEAPASFTGFVEGWARVTLISLM